jgi:cellobiose phosphorylase
VTLAMPPLQLSTGAGGYSADGGQYVLRLAEDRRASGGWTSALGDADCGLLVEPAGRLRVRLAGAAVSSATLAFYLRDEESGHFWSPAPWPVRGRGDYLLRHGLGYSAFDHVEGGIASTLTLCAPPGAGAVHAILRMYNGGAGVRRLSATPYLEWPGTGRAVLRHDARTGCLVLDDAAAAHAIVLAASLPGTATGARAEFIGRCRNLATPAAMLRRHLSDRCDDNAAGCAARMVPFELAAGATLELEFALVRGGRRPDDLAAAAATGAHGRAAGALEAAQATAHAACAVLQVETPDAALDQLLNGWLAAQVRSALAARAGADALGLASALVLVEPALVWAELCRVGVAADLWLPIAVARYVDATGDLALFEAAPWLFERCVQALAAGTGGAVWRAWLRCDALARFAAVAGLRGAAALAEDCAGQARACALALEREAWTGDGYRATLGAQGAAASAADDALAQIWAVLSGAADPQRARQALASFESDCAMRGVTRLPAQTILWAAMAHARMRDAERALELALHVDPALPDNAAGLHVLFAEAILGLRAQAGKASIAPCVPARWPGFSLRWKTVKTVYIVSAERGDPAGIAGDTAAVLPSGGEQQVALRL